MHVVFVSACEKKALKRSRALLDSYALRTGDRSWATPITEEALEELRSALSRTATRQTAVACYKNEGRTRMRLLWIVGSRKKFGDGGQFCIGERRKSAAIYHPAWVKLACLVASTAGLVHDFGKYSQKFQTKLRSDNKEDWVDAIRHEWISMKLAQNLRGLPDSAHAWADAWRELRNDKLCAMRFGDRVLDNSGDSISTPMECVDAIVSTHHKLFAADICGSNPRAMGKLIRTDQSIDPEKDPLLQPFGQEPDSALLAQARRLEERLQKLAAALPFDSDPTPLWHGIFLLARAAVIFADHTVSAREYPDASLAANCEIAIANTRKSAEKERLANQPLINHLREVSAMAGDTLWRMSHLLQSPTESLFGLEPCVTQKILEPSGPESRFAWQDRAVDALEKAREELPDSPVLLFNMAGTGCGKTRMNVKAACAISRMGQPRISIALNLRTLTLQTGHAMRCELGLDDNDCATVIGDAVATRLFQAANNEEGFADPWEESEILAQGGKWPLPAWLEAFFRKPRERKIIGAPLLVSTIDFLVAAGEPFQQGHHVKAMLRVMTSDLVLDEVDAYEPEAMVAVLRLVQLAGLFGRNVICSSATLSLPVQQAVDAAFASGLEMGRKMRSLGLSGENRSNADAPLYLRACIDNDLEPEIQKISGAGEAGCGMEARIKSQMEIVRNKPCYRLAKLLPIGQAAVQNWQEAVLEGVKSLHGQNSFLDQQTGLRLSFGLVRVANIGTAIATARYLANALPSARVACYHSNDWRISRFYKEQRLDFLLTRKNSDPNDHILRDSEIRAILDESKEKGHDSVPFVVVATPVEEIGRDHDFDWAVIDVSSAQSLVQTAGRVNRHRLVEVDQPNIAVPQYNWRHCHNCDNGKPQKPAFCWPGYESDGERYSIHDLKEILPWQDDGCLMINADIRFGECRLARRDDRSIVRNIADYFANANVKVYWELKDKNLKGWNPERLFVKYPLSPCLLADTIYLKTRLRTDSGITQTWRLDFDKDTCENKYEEFVYNNHKWQWVERGRNFVSFVQAMPNAWLWHGGNGLQDLCEKFGLEPDEGMIVDLTRYERQQDKMPLFEYDQGFGIKRA